MSRSGEKMLKNRKANEQVLIPLLVDVPLWVPRFKDYFLSLMVLIPLLVDVPLWADDGRAIQLVLPSS